MLAEIEGGMRYLMTITNVMHVRLSKLQELVMDRERCPACCSPWGHKELDKTEQLNLLIGRNLSVLFNLFLSYPVSS